jgi:hypothetical protein
VMTNATNPAAVTPPVRTRSGSAGPHLCDRISTRRQDRPPPKQPGASKGATTSFTAPAY